VSWLGAEEYWADIMSDALRFYGWWVDIENDTYPDGLTAPQLIQMLERLPLYDGALTVRAKIESSQHGGVTPAGQIDQFGREEVGSSGAELLSHPALAGLVDYKQV
jgi:hypothetical protein